MYYNLLGQEKYAQREVYTKTGKRYALAGSFVQLCPTVPYTANITCLPRQQVGAA